jgi:hypothetical protein
VSEYQYYDFRAIDRPLTKKEMGSLRSISTRAAITTTSFTNHYERSDLKANPSKLLEKYFDAFVSLANWGRMSFVFAFRRNRSTRGCWRPWPRAIPSGCEKPRH